MALVRDQAASNLPWSEALAPICRIVLQAPAFPMGIAGWLKSRARWRLSSRATTKLPPKARELRSGQADVSAAARMAEMMRQG